MKCTLTNPYFAIAWLPTKYPAIPNLFFGIWYFMVFHILLVWLVFDQVLSKPFYKWYDLLHMKWIWASLFDDYSTESSHGMINQCSTSETWSLIFFPSSMFEILVKCVGFSFSQYMYLLLHYIPSIV